MKELVERALQRELAARRDLRPHAQLAIQPTATAAEIDRAYARLRRQYETVAIAEYGPGAVAAANGIAALLRTAHEAMRQSSNAGISNSGSSSSDGGETIELLPDLEPRPHRDETCRALEALRAAIARRLAEAETHRRAGRRHDAIRVLESVLLLDRGNAPARQALRELREAIGPRRQNALSRMFRRVFGRQRMEDQAETP